MAQLVKNSPANVGDTRDMSLIPGSERSPGEGNDNALQYPCLENSMDRGAWRAILHGVARVRDDLATKQHHVVTVVPGDGRMTRGWPHSAPHNRGGRFSVDS